MSVSQIDAGVRTLLRQRHIVPGGVAEPGQNDAIRAGLEVRDRIDRACLFLNHESVGFGAAGERVVALAAPEEVPAGAAAQGVVAAPALELVGDRIAGEGVVAFAADGVLEVARARNRKSRAGNGRAAGREIDGAIAQSRGGIDGVFATVGVVKHVAPAGRGELGVLIGVVVIAVAVVWRAVEVE